VLGGMEKKVPLVPIGLGLIHPTTSGNIPTSFPFFTLYLLLSILIILILANRLLYVLQLDTLVSVLFILDTYFSVIPCLSLCIVLSYDAKLGKRSDYQNKLEKGKKSA
jgi:hypothetical protein